MEKKYVIYVGKTKMQNGNHRAMFLEKKDKLGVECISDLTYAQKFKTCFGAMFTLLRLPYYRDTAKIMSIEDAIRVSNL